MKAKSSAPGTVRASQPAPALEPRPSPKHKTKAEKEAEDLAGIARLKEIYFARFKREPHIPANLQSAAHRREFLECLVHDSRHLDAKAPPRRPRNIAASRLTNFQQAKIACERAYEALCSEAAAIENAFECAQAGYDLLNVLRDAVTASGLPGAHDSLRLLDATVAHLTDFREGRGRRRVTNVKQVPTLEQACKDAATVALARKGDAQ